MDLRIGCHVPPADPLAAAEARGATVVQVFLSNPRSWKPPVPRDDAAVLRAADLPVYVHAPYIVNVATTNPQVRHPSRKTLEQTVRAAEAIGAAGVVVHGGHLPEGEDIEQGYAHWRSTLERLETTMPILIENTAGGSNAVARHLDRIGRLWEALDGVETPVGFVLDTCHAHAAGEELPGIVARVRALVGRIDLVHLNDSKDAAGCGRDRHELLGKGQIPEELLVEIVREAAADTVLEVSGDAAEHREQIAWIRDRL
jgi:deoxyribonuclease IV